MLSLTPFIRSIFHHLSQPYLKKWQCGTLRVIQLLCLLQTAHAHARVNTHTSSLPCHFCIPTPGIDRFSLRLVVCMLQSVTLPTLTHCIGTSSMCASIYNLYTENVMRSFIKWWNPPPHMQTHWNIYTPDNCLMLIIITLKGSVLLPDLDPY